MKLKLFLILIFISTLFSSYNYDEDNITCVTYKMLEPLKAENENINKKLNDENLPENLKISLKKTNEYKSQIELELYYNKTQSLYKIIDKMDTNDDFSLTVAKILLGGDQIRYKDLTKKEKLFQIETSGQKFNVNLPFDEYQWDISNESKLINGYKCFKATSYKEEFDKIRNRINRLNVVAWFTPEIPTSFGPAGLDGLPGLVLEGSTNGKLFLYATKINFDCNSKIKIERPINGKEVSENEYLDIIGKMFEKN